MSNAERQAAYRSRLKDAAAANFETLFRSRVEKIGRELLADRDYCSRLGRETLCSAITTVAGMTRGSLAEVMKAAIVAEIERAAEGREGLR